MAPKRFSLACTKELALGGVTSSLPHASTVEQVTPVMLLGEGAQGWWDPGACTHTSELTSEVGIWARRRQARV